MSESLEKTACSKGRCVIDCDEISESMSQGPSSLSDKRTGEVVSLLLNKWQVTLLRKIATRNEVSLDKLASSIFEDFLRSEYLKMKEQRESSANLACGVEENA